MNRYSLNVYQVVCLVIGLCCVWCSAVRNSDEMELADISKDATLDIDSQIKSVYAELTNEIDNLKLLNENQTKQIDLIKQGQQNLKKEEREVYEKSKSTQSDCSFSDKSKDRFRQKKIELLSQLIREEVIQKSVNIVIQQMEQRLFECKRIQTSKKSKSKSKSKTKTKREDKLADIVQQLNQIKSALTGLQKPSRREERIIAENNLITIGAYYNYIVLKSRIKVIIIEELTEMVPKIDMLNGNDLTNVMDSMIDQVLKYDKLKSPNSISRIIEKTLAQLDGTSKNTEVKSESESKQEPTDSEPSNSRAQLCNPQTNESGMDGKLHSSNKSADQDSTSSFNRYGLKLPELDQKDCTPNLNSKEVKLLWKFISNSNEYTTTNEAPPVWRAFNINEDNQPRKYGVFNTSLQYDHKVYLSLDWEESELMELLDVLKKFNQIIFNVEKVWLWYPRGPAGLLVLSQLLTLIQNPELNAMKKPLEITISLPDITCPSLESSFNDVKKREQFRNQIEEIEESRYIIRMSIHGLTSNVQKFIWPLVTHLSISKIDIVYPNMTKIDFLDDVNWINEFVLRLELDYQKDLTISLGARTAKDKDLPFCAYLSIRTNLSNQGQPPSSSAEIHATGLTEYIGPNSFVKNGKTLCTSYWVSPGISTKDGHKLDHLKRIN
ncbi:hypothetical protein NEHOM01_1109 [Nematocida homosporus]|uniref:uncharacterized protein n=1 Tax=Nematocida homosporus TaxID=1912981 RepID=UPI0022211634|nr:uncharacterized protein NEHOM01_1109 [Nematocida homosporus]KAI5185859.1 hypothetical protein NEHOM01_1109 [Nematocida homosporus]